MDGFFDFLRAAMGAPTAKLFIVFGLLFLGVAIVGSITGRIQPGPIGRILGGLVGPLLIVVGLGMEMSASLPPVADAAMTSLTPVPTAIVVNTMSPKSTVKPNPTPIPTTVPASRTPTPTPRTLGPKTLPTLTSRYENSLEELRNIRQIYDQKAIDLINN
jgi:hypothetical protein